MDLSSVRTGSRHRIGVVSMVTLAGAILGGHTVHAEGLTATGSEFLYQGASGVPGTPGNDESFGYGLAAGDFDGNGYDDIAIGASGDFGFAGSVTVIYRDSGGTLSTQVVTFGLGAPITGFGGGASGWRLQQ